ncbi:citrate synthase/methylcitrate synthase [Leifsonia shinshuensis]|uniref:citrate/2-methylcitrate synthase n=1 Tax=Leifsonia shinshuensis TaxID=150026 RepID=UPI001F511F66|nr:citrate/2-methylcitrate synthase [Leifsonia shinshuensis]MCI0155921.1 citrate synthase/methylcitrate synthase [Leifsonia shinshuensis]
MDRMNDTLIDVPRGLTNVVAAHTALGDVRGQEGFYHYRQYSAIDLARERTFEDAWYLLLFGDLPTAEELGAFRERIAAARRIPGPVAELLPAIARLTAGGDVLAGLRMALAAVAAHDGMRPVYDQAPEARTGDAIRVAAVTPVLLAALHAHATGRVPAEPRDDLGQVADYLRLVTGRVPDAAHEHALSAYLTAAIDHGFNASTFTARVIASTGADVAAAVDGALGALSGPLHGGAPSRALDTLDAIGTPDRIDDWITATVRGGGRVMGFGHAVYRTEDPRSRLLREVAQGFGGDRVAFAVQVENRVQHLLTELKPGRELHTNVEFYAGVVMELCGIPRSLFTPTFAVARVVGWTAHILEQAADGKILRPSSRYDGPRAPEPLPARTIAA